MPTFEVTDPNNGQTLELTGDSPPTEQELESIFSGGEQESGLRSKADPSEFLSPTERVQTGFRVNPDQFLENRRAQLGLESGTALEPTPQTASLMENIKDIPGDLLDVLGPAFPAIGQFFGATVGGAASIPTTGGTAAPLAIAQGGIAGAIGGEVARQSVGAFMGLEEQGLSDRAKRVAIEGAFGAAGEGAVVAGNALIRATKRGIIKAGEKTLSRKGIEGFAAGFSKIVNNLDPDKFKFALKAARAGDNSVFTKEFAEKNFASDLADELFFGKDNNPMKQIHKLASKKDAKNGIKLMYKAFFNIQDESIDLAIKHGEGLKRMGNLNNVKSALGKLSKNIGKSFDDVGSKLGSARKELVEQAGSIDVSDAATQINKQLADSLAQPGRGGLLSIIDDGVYSINPEFATTATGKGQSATFSDFITKMFTKSRHFSPAREAALKKALIEGDQAAIEKITRGVTFNAKVEQTYKQFAEKLSNLDIQISGKEFDRIGKLSPELTVYIRSLREVTDGVASQVGNRNIPLLNAKYKNLVENLDLVTDGAKAKNFKQLESVLNKYTSPKTAIEQLNSDGLESFFRENLDSNIFNNIRAYKAVKDFAGIEDAVGSLTGRSKFTQVSKNAFAEGPVSELMKVLERDVDPFLPVRLKPGLNAQRHTTAEALHKDALAILKGRFLSTGLGLPSAIAIGTGGAISGLGGATAGLGLGLGLQNPTILRNLIKTAAKAPAERALQIPLGEVGSKTAVATSQLLKALLEGNQ